ncbi:MAG: DUF5131 family protein [Candidatus Helarchaeota archaeon]
MKGTKKAALPPGKKNIEYANESWNPYSGCYPVNCAVDQHLKNTGGCWARRMADRMAGRYGYDKLRPFQPTWHAEQLEKPLHWKKPRRIAACFMGDIAWADDFQQIQILNISRKTPQHIYYYLTKLPKRYDFPPEVRKLL